MSIGYTLELHMGKFWRDKSIANELKYWQKLYVCIAECDSTKK